MDQIEQVLHHIEQRRQFVLTSHARPDGDAIGSALALAGILRKMGKSAEVILSDSVPVIYKPLPFSNTIIHATHVVLGMAALLVLYAFSRKESLTKNQHAFVEGGACFWHLVDLLWIMLFALLYLMH